MEMAYREGGGLLLPTLATEEEAAANLGPFALMRDEYLRSSKPELRADLLAQGALARHLAETEALFNIEEKLLSLLPGPADTE